MFFYNFNTIIQIITNLFIIIGGIIAIWQYLASKQNESYQYNKERIHLAIDIADYYKDNVLAHSRKLKNIVESIGVFDISENIKLEDIEYFDIVECKKIYTKSQLETITETRLKYGIDKYVSEKSVSYRAVSAYNKLNKTPNFKQINDSKALYKTGQKYTQLMFEILNNLEVFSMYFVHEVADDSVVYQPLHMSFLEIVRILYYDISYANRNGEQRFYVNTIKLFNIWKKKSLQQQEIETKACL